MIVRIAIITESFPPDVNGVAHCVLRVAEHLARHRDHHPMVIAPEPGRWLPRPDGALGYPVVRVPSLPVPGYSGFRVAAPGPRLRAALTGHGTELVHLASPFVLGTSGALAAGRLRLPVVAVYQTDMPAYARAYRCGPAGQAIAWRRLRRIHNAAARTLAPSTTAAAHLHEHGIGRVWLWGRGVDTVRFDPARRSEQVRAGLAPGGEVLAGYVGRLAPEKRVDAGDAAARDPRMWAVDRLHPSERGHRLIACRFHDQLAAAGVPTGPRPDPEPSSPPPARLAEIGWLATKGTAWVLRRSIDLVPGLLAMALREWSSGGQADSGGRESAGLESGANATRERAAARPGARQAR